MDIAEVYVLYNLWWAASEQTRKVATKKAGEIEALKHAAAADQAWERLAEASFRAKRRGQKEVEIPRVQPVVASVDVVCDAAPFVPTSVLREIKKGTIQAAFWLYFFIIGWLLTPDARPPSGKTATMSMAELTARLVAAKEQRRSLAASIAQARGQGWGSWFRFSRFGLLGLRLHFGVAVLMPPLRSQYFKACMEVVKVKKQIKELLANIPEPGSKKEAVGAAEDDDEKPPPTFRKISTATIAFHTVVSIARVFPSRCLRFPVCTNRPEC